MAVLPNFKLIFAGWSRKWRGGVATIKSFRGERVRGAIYEVSEVCLRKLDTHEAGYERLNVTVFSDDEPVQAVTYIKTGQLLEEASPSSDYLAVIQQGLRDWRLF